MKKRLFAGMIIAGVLCAGFTGCTSDTATNSQSAAPSAASQTKAPVKATAPAEKKDCDLKILGSSVGKDVAGNPILIVEYEFTNYKDTAMSFSMSTNDKAFQNGVECSSAVVSNEIDAKQQLDAVKKDTAYVLKVGYALKDTTTPVELEIKDFLAQNDILKQTIELG